RPDVRYVTDRRRLLGGDRDEVGDALELGAHQIGGGPGGERPAGLAAGVGGRGSGDGFGDCGELECDEIRAPHYVLDRPAPVPAEAGAPSPPVAAPARPSGTSASPGSCQVPLRHAWSPIQTAPPEKYSFFQIGTVSFRRSMTKR